MKKAVPFIITFWLLCTTIAFSGDRVQAEPESVTPQATSIQSEGEVVEIFWARNHVIIIEELPARTGPPHPPPDPLISETAQTTTATVVKGENKNKIAATKNAIPPRKDSPESGD